MIDCLKDLIGLTDSNCPCIDTIDDHDDNISDSGFYVTHEMNTILPLLASKECGDGSLWDILIRAREKAKRDFLVDLRVALYDKFDSRLKKFSGKVAEEKKRSPRTIKSYAGQRWTPTKTNGGKMIIKTVDLGLTTGGDLVTVKVWTDDYSSPLGTVDITTVANTYVTGTFSPPIEIDLDNIEDDDHIYIGYDTPVGASAIGNKLTCGCSSEKLVWDQFMYARGYEKSTAPTTGEDVQLIGAYANGLRTGISLECETLDFICNLDALDGYVASDVIAKTLMYGRIITGISNGSGFHEYQFPQSGQS